MMDERRISKHALQEMGVQAQQRTLERYAQVQQKRQQRTRVRQMQNRPIPSFAGEVPTRVPNARDVEQWFSAALRAQWPGVIVARFLIEEQTLAKRLLQDFGADRVQARIVLAVQAWPRRRTVIEGYHPRIPTFMHFWKLRQEIFGEEQFSSPVPTLSPGERQQFEIRISQWAGFCNSANGTRFSLLELAEMIQIIQQMRMDCPHTMKRLWEMLQQGGADLLCIKENNIEVKDVNRRTAAEWMERCK